MISRTTYPCSVCQDKIWLLKIDGESRKEREAKRGSIS